MRILCSEAAQLSCACHHGYKPRVPWELPDGEQHSVGDTSPAWEGTDTFSTPHLAQQRRTALFSRAPGTNVGRKAVLFSPTKATVLRDSKSRNRTLCRLKSTQQHSDCCLWRAFNTEVTHSTSCTPGAAIPPSPETQVATGRADSC